MRMNTIYRSSYALLTKLFRKRHIPPNTCATMNRRNIQNCKQKEKINDQEKGIV